MAAQGVKSPALIHSPVGVVQAYDTVYLLAEAVNQAKSTQGVRIRNALEHLSPYDGAIKRYAPAYTAANHDALDRRQVLFVRMKPDGAIIPIR